MVSVADLTTPGRTMVMGIVNVTEDSFSDGGKWLDRDRAIAHAKELVAQGADMIDVGAESTRPGAVSYTHLTLPTILRSCRSRWSPYH